MEPTEKDIAYLRANPAVAGKFDTTFGEGASVSFLQPAEEVAIDEAVVSQPVTPEVAAEPVEAEAESRFSDGVIGAALHGLQETGNQLNAAFESADHAMSAKLEEYGIPSRLQILNKDGEFDPQLKTLSESAGDTDSLFGGDVGVQGDAGRVELIREPVTTFGKFTSSTTQFLAGFAGARAATGLTGLVGAAANGALADGIVFDPNDPNLTAFAAQNEYAVPLLTEALANDPEDPEWVNRMRNAAEGVIIGGALDLTLKGFRGLSMVVKGNRMGDEAGEALVKQGQELADEAAEEARDALDSGLTLEAAPVEAAPVQPSSLVDEDALRAALADKDQVDIEQIAESEWFNTSRMDGPVEAHQMIEVAGDALARSGALEKLGLDTPETFKTVIKDAKAELASLTGGSLEELTSRVARIGESSTEQAKFLVAGKIALQSTGREVGNLAKRLDGMYAVGKVDPEVEAQLLNLIDTHANLQGHLKRVQTSAARAVSAGRINTTDGLDGAAIDALTRVNDAGGSKAVQEAVKRLRLAETPAQQAALLRSMQRGTVAKRAMNVVNEVFINSILSGWGTHAVNMTSNMVNTMVLPLERSIGGALTGSVPEMKAGLNQYVALRSSVLDGVRLSGRVLKNEMPVLDTQVKLDYQNEGMKAITKENLGVTSAAGGALVEGLGHTIRLPGRFLMAEDEFFKQVMFRSRLQAKLTVDAAGLSADDLKGLGYDSKGAFIEGETEAATMGVQALNDRWDELVLKGRVSDDPEVKATFIKDNLGSANEGGSRYAQDALRVARESTFTAPLKDGTLSSGYQKLANRHPYLRQITPFIQTPVNILNKAFDRVPGLNLLRGQYRERLASSDASVRAEAAGEMATGVGLSAALVFLSMEGRITGSGPSDPKRRAMWMADDGWQPNSINVGTTEAPSYVEISRLDPFSFAMTVAGDVSEIIQTAQNDPSVDAAGAMATLIGATLKNVTNRTYLQGLSEFVDIASTGEPRKLQRWMEMRAAALVPYSSAGRTFNQSQDTAAKEARGYLDRIKANTPGMSDEVPDRYNWVDGQPVDNPSKLLGYIKVRSSSGDTVSEEMRRLNYGFSGPDRKIGAITLSSAQFQEWNKLMGSVRIGGKTLHQRLEAQMQRSTYDLNRERIPDGRTTPSESHRVEMLSGVITAYKQKSRAALFETNPELYQAWREYEEYESQAQRGQAPEGGRENLLLQF